MKRIWRNDFNKEFKNSKANFQSFSGANTKQLHHTIKASHTEIDRQTINDKNHN